MRVNRMSLKKEVKDPGMQVLFHFHSFASGQLVSGGIWYFKTERFHTVRILRWDVGRLLVKYAIVAYQRKSLLMPS